MLTGGGVCTALSTIPTKKVAGVQKSGKVALKIRANPPGFLKFVVKFVCGIYVRGICCGFCCGFCVWDLCVWIVLRILLWILVKSRTAHPADMKPAIRVVIAPAIFGYEDL